MGPDASFRVVKHSHPCPEVCKGELWLCQHHFGQPPRILLDLLQMGFFSLPGSTWLLTHSFLSCHQQRFHLAFSPGCPGPDSWHFFRSWLWLPLLSLYGWTAESGYVSLETALQRWLIVGLLASCKGSEEGGG